MKIALAQIKLKTANFTYNYENIVKNIENTEADLIVFPSAELSSLGGKDLVFDENLVQKEIDLYEKIAENDYDKAVLIGNVLIKNGIAEDVEFFELNDKKIFIVCVIYSPDYFDIFKRS